MIIGNRQNLLLKELDFQYSRSSGPGGQHVNKTDSRVEVRFDVMGSQVLSTFEKNRLTERLSAKINVDGILYVTCQDSRSQLKNKQMAIDKFLVLIQKALKSEKKRIRTKPSRSSIEKRIEKKKRHSEKKKNRRNYYG